LATGVGSRGASRAVGAAMSRNRILLVIPCHRVVSAGGVLRGFSAPGGLRTKQFLLDLESR
jgi:methylated-DNA-[protein]-cysteine S-methyltransferase